jgi:hypothetical protein
MFDSAFKTQHWPTSCADRWTWQQVEPAHFICLCWITHVAFPLSPCPEGVSQHTCISLHVASTIFVCMWILTGLAVIVLIVTVTFFDRNRQQNSRWWEDTFGNQAVESSLRLTQLPDPLREQIVGNLPTTSEPPADGEPCAICFDVDTQQEWYCNSFACSCAFRPVCVFVFRLCVENTRHIAYLLYCTWRVCTPCALASSSGAILAQRQSVTVVAYPHLRRILPCGHRFHPACVDEWIKKQRGTCPTCRQDPTQPLQQESGTPASAFFSAVPVPCSVS